MKPVSLKTHILTLLEKDKEFHTERDRRYYEVSQEREKALKIKEQADRDALDLARQIQTYKDEKANFLREQINRERGDYATKQDLKSFSDKMDAVLNPIVSFVASQQGRSSGLNSGWIILGQAISLIAAIIAIIVAANK